MEFKTNGTGPVFVLSMLMLLYACFSFKNNKFSQKIIDSKKDVIDTKILVVKMLSMSCRIIKYGGDSDLRTVICPILAFKTAPCYFPPIW